MPELYTNFDVYMHSVADGTNQTLRIHRWYLNIWLFLNIMDVESL
jgi:hypothetical protein